MWQPLLNDIRDAQATLDLGIRTWIDGYEESGGKVFCGKGCSGCCNLAVNTTFTEALRIARILAEPAAARVRKHASRLLERVGEAADLKSFLRLHRQEIGSCPLLEEDGSCGVYAERPLSCRSLIATRESRWCSIDFATLPAEEKEAFVAGLDRNVVAFPMHYAAAPQELAQELEARVCQRMAARFGFYLYGNLPFLIFLERRYRLSSAVARGYDATVSLLDRKGANNPFLVMVGRGAS
ncbi:MAG TPA: YkgJ family cysteine cluster protein [Geobacteraceae bacterium]